MQVVAVAYARRMSTWLDELSQQVRAQGLARRSALFAVLVPAMLLLFALVLGDGDLESYVVPVAVAAVAGIAMHLVFRWLDRRAG